METAKNLTKANEVMVCWLGGAGFTFTFGSDLTICIDPYLSDSVERLFGFRRLSIAPIKPEDLHFNVLLFTHDHADHLDIDSFDSLMQANPDCCILAPKSCSNILEQKSIQLEITSPGSIKQFGKVMINTVAADHGELCPDAAGYIISFNGRKLYFTGDTALNEKMMVDAITAALDIIVPCINGAYGNMNESEAAELVVKCRARVAIPSHFWLFAEHGGNPQTFRENVKAISPDTEVVLLTPGRAVAL